MTSRGYVNGEEAFSSAVTGQLSRWDETLPVLFGDEECGGRPFLGRIYLVAPHRRWLPAADIQTKHEPHTLIVVGPVDGVGQR
jgi:hypothetical protein